MLVHSHVPGLEALGTRIAPTVYGVVIRGQKIACSQILLKPESFTLRLTVATLQLDPQKSPREQPQFLGLLFRASVDDRAIKI